MKKVIFICLLSFSVCLSKPSEPAAATAPPSNNHELVQPVSTNQTPKKEDPTPHVAETTTKINTVPGAPAVKSTEPTTKHATADPAKEGEPKNTSPSTPSTILTPATKATGSSSPVPPTTIEPAKNASTPADHDKASNSTTLKPDAPSKPTEAPKEGDKIVQARGFDGASFIGGIILTLGLLAIGFMGFKYYKNQTERNYHTL